MNIVITDKFTVYPDHLKRLHALGDVILHDDIPQKSELIQRIREADIAINNWVALPKEILQKASKLKIIAVAATGYEWIDLAQAKRQGITVCNVPNYSTEAVAEHTIGLLLSAARLASNAERDIRSTKWNPTEYKGKELKGKTLGVVGYGAIGKRVAEMASQGFSMNIRYINSSSTQRDIETLLQESDFITINAPLTEKTRGLLGRNEFSLMKKGIIIVNTGRGAVIDEQALMDNLKNGKVFAAGLDVFAEEPLRANHLFFSLPNVTLTPHIAFNTEESEYQLSQMVTENIELFVKGTPRFVVN